MKQRLKPQVILLGLVSLLNDSASEMIYPLLPVFLTSTLGATPIIVGLIEGTADALASILKLGAGWISDRLPRRKPLIVGGYALATISRAWISVAGRWVSILGARLLDRTGKGLRSAPRDAMIADVTPLESRGRAFGLHRALDHTGAVAGPLLAIVFLDALQFSVRTVFMIAVIPGAIGVAVLMLALKEVARLPGSRVPGKPAARQPGNLPRPFYYALASIALFSLANSSDAFLLLQAHGAGVATGMLPILWSAHHIIRSLFSTWAGTWSDRVGRRSLLIAGWCAYGLIYFAFPFAHSMQAFFALFVVYAIPFTLTEGAERAWVGDLVPATMRGKSFGLYYLTTGLFGLAGTALFGALYQIVSPRAAFFTGAAIAMSAAVFLVAARFRPEPHAPEE